MRLSRRNTNSFARFQRRDGKLQDPCGLSSAVPVGIHSGADEISRATDDHSAAPSIRPRASKRPPPRSTDHRDRAHHGDGAAQTNSVVSGARPIGAPPFYTP